MKMVYINSRRVGAVQSNFYLIDLSSLPQKFFVKNIQQFANFFLGPLLVPKPAQSIDRHGIRIGIFGHPDLFGFRLSEIRLDRKWRYLSYSKIKPIENHPHPNHPKVWGYAKIQRFGQNRIKAQRFVERIFSSGLIPNHRNLSCPPCSDI